MNLTDADIRKAGGKVTKIRLPDPPEQQKLCNGMVVAWIVVEGRAVPWSVSRKGTKNRALSAWQQRVASMARQVHGLRESYRHPVRLEMTFYLKQVMDQHEPDLTNLQKGLEDALQGTVIK